MADLTESRRRALDELVQDILDDNHIELQQGQTLSVSPSVPLHGRVYADASEYFALIRAVPPDHDERETLILLNNIQALETGYILHELGKRLPDTPDISEGHEVHLPMHLRVIESTK